MKNNWKNVCLRSMVLTTCLLCLVLNDPLVVQAAAGIAPNYISHYGCKTVATANLSEEHEKQWRSGTIQTHPKVIATRSGGTIVMWEEQESSNENEGLPRIYLQALDKHGARLWGDDGISSSNTIQKFGGGVLTGDDADGAYVVWQEYGLPEGCANEPSIKSGIRLQHINNKGKRLLGNKGMLLTDINHKEQRIDLVSDGSGGVLVSYLDASSLEIVIQRINSKGRALWEKGRTSIRSPQKVWNPFYKAAEDIKINTIKNYKMVPDGHGGVFVVWMDSGSGIESATAQHISAEGKPSWNTPVYLGPGQPHNPGKLLVRNEELIYVRDTYHYQKHNKKQYAYRYVTITRIKRSSKEISFYANNTRHRITEQGLSEDDYHRYSEQRLLDAQLAQNGDVIFLSYERPDDDLSRYSLYAQRVSADGKKQWKKNPLKAHLYSIRGGRLLNSGDDNFTVVWDEHVATSNDSGVIAHKIFTRRISADGTLLEKQPVILLRSEEVDVDQSFDVAHSSTGGFHITWPDGRRSFTDPDNQDPNRRLSLYTIYMQQVGGDLKPRWYENGVPVSISTSPK
jgi:hypothetical protein